MIPILTKQKLMKNWGDKAESLACYAECKYFDELSLWSCYVIAMNPEDQDEVLCIIDGHDVEVMRWKLSELYECFNVDGEAPEIDRDYRPMWASALYKKLNGNV